MKITLTNAHRIRKNLEGLVNSSSFGQNLKKEISLNIYEQELNSLQELNSFVEGPRKRTNAETFVTREIEKTKENFKNEFTKLKNTVDVLVDIRQKISKVNKEHNISDYLDKESAISYNIKLLTNVIENVTTESVPSVKFIINKVESNIKKHNDPNAYGASPVVNVDVIDKDSIASYKSDLLKAKREQRNLLDTITGLNSSNYISLSDEQYSFIESLGFI